MDSNRSIKPIGLFPIATSKPKGLLTCGRNFEMGNGAGWAPSGQQGRRVPSSGMLKAWCQRLGDDTEVGFRCAFVTRPRSDGVKRAAFTMRDVIAKPACGDAHGRMAADRPELSALYFRHAVLMSLHCHGHCKAPSDTEAAMAVWAISYLCTSHTIVPSDQLVRHSLWRTWYSLWRTWYFILCMYISSFSFHEGYLHAWRR